MAEEKKINEQSEENENEAVAEETPDTKKVKEKGAKKDGDAKKCAKLEKEIEELKAQIEEQNDKYMRMFAEYENYRKRAVKEKEEVYAYAYGDVLKEILPVIDNLERALGYADSTKVVDGVNLTLTQFVEIMKKLGVEEVEAQPGSQFDPNVHNAVMHTEDESFGENEIVEVFQKGYRRGDKIIRHPMVRVAN